MNNSDYFILSRHWADTNDGIELRIWLVGEKERLCWRIPHERSVCFIAHSQRQQWLTVFSRFKGQIPEIGHKRFSTFSNEEVVPVYSHAMATQRRWVSAGQKLGLRVWEDDINPVDRYLMERFLFGGLTLNKNHAKPAQVKPQLKILSIDIETAWFQPGTVPDLYSVALVCGHHAQVWVVNDNAVSNVDDGICLVPNIESCLQAVVRFIEQTDPDCIIGWNVIDFDLRILQQHADRLNVPFNLGRDQQPMKWRKRTDYEDRWHVSIEGRQVVDGPGAFRSAAWMFEDYSLETVSRQVLNRGKKIDDADNRVGHIEHLYRHDLNAFAAYNLEDAQLVIDLFEKADLWGFLISRCHLTGLGLDRVQSSSAAFNTVYLPRLHRKGMVANRVGEQRLTTASPGGFVMDSAPGIYRDVLVLDFKSLYPSIIRTFLVDPVGLQLGLAAEESDTVPGFLGARFHRTEHLLPALIEQLGAARDQAKREKNAPLSQALKIIMNSFYGVLGSPRCRFFDPRLASSITMRGHQILQKTRELIEAEGLRVIYGDTDSVFVALSGHENPKALGHQLVAKLNQWWADYLDAEFSLPSFLELEFETHYEQFVMPTIRGSEKGSKKRYAGWMQGEIGYELVFKGLEAVRSDWTPFAKMFQRELYQRVFTNQPVDAFIRDSVSQLQSGLVDDQLFYKRRLRRRLEDYAKQQPPHVQAAQLRQRLDASWDGRSIVYARTVQGWQPQGFVSAPLDYQHYLDKQLAPIADALLHFKGLSFRELINAQAGLF